MSARRAPAAAMSPQAGSGPVFCGMAVPLVADELQPARGGHAWMRRYPRSAEEGGLWRVTRRPEPIRPSTTEADDAMWCVPSRHTASSLRRLLTASAFRTAQAVGER